MILACRSFSVRQVAIGIAVSFALLFCAAVVAAQASRVGATLEGTVTDTSGAVIPNSKVRHPPQSGWLGEWGRLKGGCPVGLGVALKRAFVDEFRSCRYYHPRPLVRGCICKLAPTRNPPWTLRIHGPRSARP